MKQCVNRKIIWIVLSNLVYSVFHQVLRARLKKIYCKISHFKLADCTRVSSLLVLKCFLRLQRNFICFVWNQSKRLSSVDTLSMCIFGKTCIKNDWNLITKKIFYCEWRSYSQCVISSVHLSVQRFRQAKTSSNY